MEPGKAENVRYLKPSDVSTTVEFAPRGRTELAWAAGFFDGEGHAYFASRLDRRRGLWSPTQGLIVTQGEPGTLHRFRAALGLGRVIGPYRNGKYRPMYQWRVGSFEETQAAIALLWNFLSPPKRQQARYALVAAQAWRAGA